MERLQKVIANAGIASRRKAEELITKGRVTVNGKTVREQGIKVTGSDKVEVNGVPLSKEEHRYFVLYKPRGVLSASSDDKKRKVVTDYFDMIPERVYPVGRLDYDTSGLIVLTNDGDFANILMHPKYKVEKTYVARVKGIPTRETIKQLQDGVRIDGRKTAKARAHFMSGDKGKDKAIVELTIHEGRNHQVRKMFEAVGHPVQKLKREQYGMLVLGNLAPGEWRELSVHEVKQMYALATTGKK